MKKIIPLAFLFCAFLLNTKAETIVLQPGLQNGKDAYVTSSRPNDNANTGVLQSITWTDQGNLCVTRSFLAFDLSQIPANATITSAKLSLYYNPTAGLSYTYQTGDNACYIQRVTSDWNETNINWNNQPTTTTEGQLSLPASTTNTQDYLNMDVTNLVDSMRTLGNYGFMIRMQDEIDYYRSLLFASSNYATDSLRPKLEITYTINETGCTTLQPNASNGKDAYVTSSRPNDNANTGVLQAITWTDQGTLCVTRAFLAFDLSQIPTNAAITSAKLSLYYNPTAGLSYTYQTGDNACYIQRVTSNWDQTTINWNNQPTTTTEGQLSLPASTTNTQNYLDIDVTDLANSMHTLGNYGFMIRMQDETDYYRSLLFASSDYATDSLRPKLEVCWSIANGIIPINSNNKNGKGIDIYPNPNNGTFSLQLEGDNNISSSNIEIYDLLGNKINFELKGNQINLNKKGIFILKAVDENKNIMSEKVIVQ